MTAALLIILIGFIGTATLKNVIKKIIALDIMNVGIVMLFVTVSSKKGSLPPVIISGKAGVTYSDPIPQAVIITAIVIGFSILTLSTVLATMLADRKKKVNVDEFERMMEE